MTAQRVRHDRLPRRLQDIPGWFKKTDIQLFEWLLTKAAPDSGDLLEIGVYHGKSAILMGSFLRPGERFTVCDLFDGAGEDTSIHPAERRRYRGLSRSEFERNYLAFHDQLPTIVCAPSSTIVDHVPPGSLRFAHVDGSHLYDHVRQDLLSVRRLLRPDGVVAFDDYRAEHCPGTAAAVWEGVVSDGLRPICVTPNKLYGTWGNPEAIQSVLADLAHGHPWLRIDRQNVMGQDLLRVFPTTTHGPVPWHEPGWRRVAVAVLPPIAVQALRDLRRLSATNGASRGR